LVQRSFASDFLASALKCFRMKKSTAIREEGSAAARETKALVALAFRNGPIENVHAGKACPTCQGDPQYSHITQAEMRQIMKAAVDRLYTFLVLKQHDQKAYEALPTLTLSEEAGRVETANKVVTMSPLRASLDSSNLAISDSSWHRAHRSNSR
jgi:hypothetical protein